MVTELFESYDQFETKKSFSVGISFGAFGADNTLALSKESERFRSAFDSYEIGISKQQYKLYELEVKPEIFGYCPYVDPIFTAEKMDLEDKSAARPPPSDGVVADWDAKAVGKWLNDVSLSHFSENFVKRGVTGPLLLILDDKELADLGVTSPFDKAKLKFELKLARAELTEEQKEKMMGESTPTEDGASDIENEAVLEDVDKTAVDDKKTEQEEADDEYDSALEDANEDEEDDDAKAKAKAKAQARSPLFLELNTEPKLKVFAKKLITKLKDDPDSVNPKVDVNPTKSTPRFVRKWILRQSFMDAVNALPILSKHDTAKICDDVSVYHQKHHCYACFMPVLFLFHADAVKFFLLSFSFFLLTTTTTVRRRGRLCRRYGYYERGRCSWQRR